VYQWIDRLEDSIARAFSHLLMLLMYLNLGDALLTLIWVKLEIAEELNPMMDHLLDVGGWRFVAYKTFLVGLCGWALWRHRERKSVRYCLVGCLGVYVYVASIHLRIIQVVCCS